jgi:transcription elongation factor Elf1
MRKGNIRLFVCFALVFCLISISFSALAVGCTNNSDHDTSYAVPDGERVFKNYTFKDTKQHNANYKQYYHCDICGPYLGSWATYPAVAESHGSTYVSDQGHVSGKTSHRYQASCSKCGFVRTKTYTCPGNPCILPY